MSRARCVAQPSRRPRTNAPAGQTADDYDLVQQPSFDDELINFLQDTFKERRAASTLAATSAAAIEAQQQSASPYSPEPESHFSHHDTFDDLFID
jgi:hypothetical protein